MISITRISKYRVMWQFVMFDLPTETKRQRRDASIFRKRLLQHGFTMWQYSVYLHHMASDEGARAKAGLLKKLMPAEGFICILKITDKQYADMEVIHGRKVGKPPNPPGIQMELF